MFRLAAAAAAVALLLLLTKDFMVRTIAERRIRQQTGLGVRIDRCAFNPLASAVTLEGLKLYNTPEFGGGLFLDIPEVSIELDQFSLLRRQLRLTLLRCHVAELGIVRNETGHTNVISILNKVRDQAANRKRTGTDWHELNFGGIDVLNLTIDKERYTDLRDRRNDREISVGVRNQVFRNVNSEADVYGIVVILWLRSGGRFTITPDDVARDYLKRQVRTLENSARELIGAGPAGQSAK